MEHAKNRLPDPKSQIGNGSVVVDFEVHPGAGVGCKVGDRTVLVGNKRLMKLSNVPINSEVENYFSDNEKLARTCVIVSIDGKVAGAFAVTDPVKPEAAQVISILRSMNINSIMVTGDNWSTATAIAKEVGIENVFAEIDPVGKADRIKDLQVNEFYSLNYCILVTMVF